MSVKITFSIIIFFLIDGHFANFDFNFLDQNCTLTNFVQLLNHKKFPQSKVILKKKQTVEDFLKTASSEQINQFDYIKQRFLDSSYFDDFIDKCQNHYSSLASISYSSIYTAIEEAVFNLFEFLENKQAFIEKQKPKQVNIHANQAEMEGRFLLFISEHLVNNYCINRFEATVELPRINIKKYLNKDFYTYVKGSCNKNKSKFLCDREKIFPNYDGSCNNLQNPWLGMAFTCQRRLLPPDYSNGVSTIRNSVQGGPLPSVRLISNQFFSSYNEINPELTQMNMQWGQFMVHDTVRTVISTANLPDCCPVNSKTFSECTSVSPLPRGDPLFFMFNQTCLRIIRSSNCPECKLGSRKPMSSATHALDLSNFYGSSLEVALDIRSFTKGQLSFELDGMGNVRMPSGDIVDPLDLRAKCVVLPNFPEFKCFQNGDGIRGNQHVTLAALETLFLRRHNQHALELSEINPHWTDDRIYWEARRILTAEYNHISFSQYLPSLFSYDVLEYFDLIPIRNGYSKYDPDVDFSSIIEWSSVAGRFGHSQINSVFKIKNEHETLSFNLKQAFFEMSRIHLGFTDGLIRGLISEPAFEVDTFFVSDVKQFLYQSPNRTSGLDLVSTNIMRGRDHGLPPYIYYLEYCFGHKVKSWSDLYRYIPKKQVYGLREIYKDFRDIDFYVGGISERRLKGNAMGPTFSCINAMQWYHSKYGDRFFYEHGNQAGSFSIEQLSNIRETSTSARFICKTTDTRSAQINVFMFPSLKNPEVDCDELPEIDYSLWRDDYEFYSN